MKRRGWTLVALATLAIVVVAVGAGGATLWQRARALEGEARDLRAASDLSTLMREPQAVERLRSRMDSLERRLGGLRMARAGGWFGWLPVAGDDLRAVAAVVGAAESDVVAAKALLDGGARLRGWLDLVDATTFARGSIPLPPASARRAAAADLQRAREAASSATAMIEPLTREGFAGPLAGRLQDVAEVSRELEQAAEWGSRVVALVGALDEVSDAVTTLESGLAVGGDRAGWDIDGTVRELGELEGSLGRAVRLAGEARAAAPSGSGEGAEVLWRVERGLGALQAAAVAGSSALDALRPALEVLERGAYAPLSGESGLLEALNAVRRRPASLASAVDRVAEARRRVGELAASLPVAGADLDALDGALEGLEGGLRLARDLPLEMLGSERPMTYLVLGHTADELRATGGFVSAVWEVTVTEGTVQSVRYFDTVEVDDWDNLSKYPAPPEPLRRHMNASVWLLRDVSWAPDFPTTARLAEDMYWLGQRREVDGVIAMNQWTMQRMAEALGKIPSPVTGEPVSAEHFMQFFERQKTRLGRPYIDVMMRQTLDVLGEPSSPGRLQRLAAAAFGALRSKEVMVYLDNPELQREVAAMGWAGRLDAGPGDAIMVVDSNVGWSKVDRNIRRDVEYRVDLRRQTPRAEVTLRYTNQSGPGASGCRSQWMSRGSTYEELKNACYWDLFRVYAPRGARLLGSGAVPLPGGAVAAELGLARPGQDTLGVARRQGRTVFSGLVTVPPGEERAVSLAYELPVTVAERGGEEMTYRLHLQKQPGVRGRSFRIRVLPPEGYELADSSVSPLEKEKEGSVFSVELHSDRTLEAVFEEEG